MKISEVKILIDGKERPLSLTDIKKKLEEYNQSYIEIVTRVNILSRVLNQCNEETEHTLI